jgi:hypothetical protein
MTLERPIAWSPILKSNGTLLMSVWVNKTQKLNPSAYLFLLSDRVQNLIDRSPDPTVACQRLSEMLQEAGLQNGPLTVKDPEDGAMTLVNNSRVLNRLYLHGLPTSFKDLQPTDTLLALAELKADRAEPEERLESWASALAAMP